MGQAEQEGHGEGGGRAEADHCRLQGGHGPAVGVVEGELGQQAPAVTLYRLPQ